MASSILFFVVAMTMTTVYGQQLVVSNGTRDYFTLSQHELLQEIKIAEMQIDAVDTRYADRLDVISYQQQQLLNEIHQVNLTLLPLQALSLVRKFCIQKYDSQLVTYNAAQDQLQVCYKKASIYAASLTSIPKATISSTNAYVLKQFPLNVDSCRTFAKNQTMYEECYVDYVETATTRVNNDLNAIQNQLAQSLSNAEIYIQTAIQCSFQVEANTLRIITTTSNLIDDCNRANGKVKSFDLTNLLIGKNYNAVV